MYAVKTTRASSQARPGVTVNAITDAESKPRPRRRQEAAQSFLARIQEAEWLAVAVGWTSPVAYHNAAFTHRLAGRHYADETAGLAHAYVCTCAELGRRPDVAEACRLAFGVERLYVEPDELNARLARGLDVAIADEAELDDCVYRVGWWRRRRLRAQRYAKAYAAIVAKPVDEGLDDAKLSSLPGGSTTPLRPGTYTGLRLTPRIRSNTHGRQHRLRS